VLFLGESLTATTVAGGLLAIGGVAIINLWPALVKKRGIARS
jgi:drug/metabolite transporter (DMT)-like permease